MYSSTEIIMKLYEIVFYTADHSMMMTKFLFSFCVLNVLKKHMWHVFSIFDMSRTEDFNNVCVVNEKKNIEFLTYFIVDKFQIGILNSNIWTMKL